MKKIAVLMGSDSDLPVIKAAFAVLREYGVPFEAHVMSAHRSPEAVQAFASAARERGFGAILARLRTLRARLRPTRRCLLSASR